MSSVSDRAGWDRLLRLLGDDAAAYARLREKLVSYFRWKGSSKPDELADEALTRMAAKLDTGEEVRDATSFALGIARFVNLEVVKKEIRERQALAREGAPDPAAEQDEAETREAALAALDLCLKKLSAGDEDMIRRYQAAGGKDSAAREALAKERKLTVNALRIRAHRLRSELEACVRKRLSA